MPSEDGKRGTHAHIGDQKCVPFILLALIVMLYVMFVLEQLWYIFAKFVGIPWSGQKWQTMHCHS